MTYICYKSSDHTSKNRLDHKYEYPKILRSSRKYLSDKILWQNQILN